MNISQAAKQTGLSPKQIRDYEKQGLLTKTHRTLNGYRFYTEHDLTRLNFIANARKVGFSLQQIAQLLKLNDDPNRTSREVKVLASQHIQELTEKIADLQKMLALLTDWHCACQGDENPTCSILLGLTQESEKCGHL
ncbi:DNA-binding transcriptional activator of copper-responsive regulon genes [Canicola haemoglobinophilus]|uniref:DNA-binding transcriptional activator of copper-responsive regulon genes n=1 Tax=Canicola haemoglobinophilus TaxID=733 RepID=A0AB38HBJ5_9PAST|nr:MerR family DNA-binding protein [Canicola haemoglobinophilus]STO54118.1 DNA-binding transcriptional activator of copper-responsive regulon genes [Canicola haemoglobinophilus]STO68651.1 DNA-binding transcriptional activator of copper-responsive regulon genes [Canicola haemoglobinophilus]